MGATAVEGRRKTDKHKAQVHNALVGAIIALTSAVTGLTTALIANAVK